MYKIETTSETVFESFLTVLIIVFLSKYSHEFSMKKKNSFVEKCMVFVKKIRSPI